MAPWMTIFIRSTSGGHRYAKLRSGKENGIRVEGLFSVNVLQPLLVEVDEALFVLALECSEPAEP